MKKYKNILIGIIFILTFFVLWFWIYGKFSNSVDSIKEGYTSFYENQRLRDNISEIRSSYQKIKPDIDSVNGYFITNSEEVRFIENIESLAKENKLEVEISAINIDKNPDLAKNGLEYLVLKVNTKGSWEGIYKFLNSLEVLPYHISISKFSISKIEDDKKGNLKGFFEIYTTKKI